MSTTRFTAAAAQLTSTDDLSGNLDVCKQLASQAADRGANLLVIPECFPFLGRSEREKFAVAEVLDPDKPGPILEAVIEMATTHRMWVVGGGMPERLDGEGGVAPEAITKAYNACIVVSPDGELTSVYRKVHLFDVDIPGGAVLRESDSTAAGNRLVLTETPLARIGLSICYDLRFPELYRDLVVRHGAQVLVVPAAFTAHTGAAHWNTLLRSRAIENQCYVIAAGQVGRHNDKRESFGHSQIIDPWGDVLDVLETGTGLAVAEIDLAKVDETRSRMPCLQHQVLVPRD